MFRFLHRQKKNASRNACNHPFLWSVHTALTNPDTFPVQQLFSKWFPKGFGSPSCWIFYTKFGSPFVGVITSELVNIESAFTSCSEAKLCITTPGISSKPSFAVCQKNILKSLQRVGKPLTRAYHVDMERSCPQVLQLEVFWSCREVTDSKVAELLSLFEVGGVFALNLNTLQQI